MSWCRRGHIGLPGKKAWIYFVVFSATIKQSGGERELVSIGPYVHIILCTLLAYIDLFAASGEPSDRVCKIADAAASLKSDVWKHFAFAVEERITEGHADSKQHQLLPGYTSTRLQH